MPAASDTVGGAISAMGVPEESISNPPLVAARALRPELRLRSQVYVLDAAALASESVSLIPEETTCSDTVVPKRALEYVAVGPETVPVLALAVPAPSSVKPICEDPLDKVTGEDRLVGNWTDQLLAVVCHPPPEVATNELLIGCHVCPDW